jgi:hypothetical protein
MKIPVRVKIGNQNYTLGSTRKTLAVCIGVVDVGTTAYHYVRIIRSLDGLNYSTVLEELRSGVARTTIGFGCFGDNGILLAHRGSGYCAGFFSPDYGMTWIRTDFFNAYGFNPASVAYGNGRYVAVGQSNASSAQRAFYSADGITWTASNVPYSGVNATAFLQIVFSGALNCFVAVAQNSNSSYSYQFYYSADGTSFSVSYNPPNYHTVNIGKLCVGPGKVLTFGNDGNNNKYIFYTTNGTTWNLSGFTAGASLYGGLVPAWYIGAPYNHYITMTDANNQPPTRWRSADGLAWSQIAIGENIPTPRQGYYDACYNERNGRLCMNSTDGNYYVSDDGGYNFYARDIGGLVLYPFPLTAYLKTNFSITQEDV